MEKKFGESLHLNAPPQEFSPELKSLWHAAKDDWEKAHDIAQDINDVNGAWIHAYLHRKEGDQWNADYWYARAGKKSPKKSLDEELEDLISHFSSQDR